MIAPHPVDHTDNPEFLRPHPDIMLDSRGEILFPAGTDTVSEEFTEGRIAPGANRKNLVPDDLKIKRCTEVVRDLFADRVPVRLAAGQVPPVVIPDRAGVTVHEVRDRDDIAVCRQAASSVLRGKPAGLYLLPGGKTARHPPLTNVFIGGGQT